jgi:HK97 gp10 family phage protein
MVKGLNELEKQMKRFDNEIHKECKKVLRDSVKQVAKEARANAPKDTGEYKKSIKFKVSRSGLIAWAYAGRKGENSKRGYLGHLLEFGTANGQKAQPHFGPALNKAKATFGNELKQGINRVRGTGINAFR